jgi:hypothetical protein
MEQSHLSRLNQLFEKMLSSETSQAERYELEQLYQHYFNEGRESSQQKTNFNQVIKLKISQH